MPEPVLPENTVHVMLTKEEADRLGRAIHYLHRHVEDQYARAHKQAKRWRRIAKDTKANLIVSVGDDSYADFGKDTAQGWANIARAHKEQMQFLEAILPLIVAEMPLDWKPAGL